MTYLLIMYALASATITAPYVVRYFRNNKLEQSGEQVN